MPPNSENIEALLCAYVEGDLDEAGRAEIERYLQANPQHKKLIEELMQTRDLVRGLPRAPAPPELAESLRGHMERSLLLGDAPTRRAEGAMHRRRWPQIMAMAAVFVLAVGLAAVVIQVVIPTFRPPTLTQIPMRPSAEAPAAPGDQVAIAPDQSQDVKTQTKADAEIDKTTVTEKNAIAGNAPTANEGEPKPALAVVPTAGESPASHTSADQEELQAIKQRLASSGVAPLASDQPVILVCSSAEPGAAVNAMTQFLDAKKIVWERVPASSGDASAELETAMGEPRSKQQSMQFGQNKKNSDQQAGADNSYMGKGGSDAAQSMQDNSNLSQNLRQQDAGNNLDRREQAKAPLASMAAAPAPAPVVSAPAPLPSTQSTSAAPDIPIANGAVTVPDVLDEGRARQRANVAPESSLYLVRDMTRQQADELRDALSTGTITLVSSIRRDATAGRASSVTAMGSSATTQPTTMTAGGFMGGLPVLTLPPATTTQPAVDDHVDVVIVVKGNAPTAAPGTQPAGN